MIKIGQLEDLHIYINIKRSKKDLVLRRGEDLFYYINESADLFHQLRIIENAHASNVYIVYRGHNIKYWNIANIDFYHHGYSIKAIKKIIFNSDYIKDLMLLTDILE